MSDKIDYFKSLSFLKELFSQRTTENKICVISFTSGDSNFGIQLFSCEDAASVNYYRQITKSSVPSVYYK